MKWLLPLLGLTSQVPIQVPVHNEALNTMATNEQDFQFKTGDDVFSPLSLLELPRPGGGVANAEGDLILVPVSSYSLKEKENHKYLHIASVDSSISPLQIPLPKGGSAFWLDSRTVAHVVSSGDSKPYDLYAISVKTDDKSIAKTTEAALIGTFPNAVTPANFRYSAESSTLVFSAYTYPDANLSSVAEQDEKWNNRGNTAMVYDTTFVRHWDTWKGPKRSTLFTVSLSKDGSGSWSLGKEYVAPLKGTLHYVPVEPFGGTDDFDISGSHIVYTTKDPELQPAAHTKQDVYVTDFKGTSPPRLLTSGKQGATHSPVFSKQGDKVAWLELEQDGYESDRSKIVVYDLNKDVRYTLTQNWDRSPDSLAFSTDDASIFFTAGDEAHVKLFHLPIPITPQESTTDPKFPAEFQTPIALSHTHAASSIQPLSKNRVIYTQSSYTSPNEVFIIREVRTSVEQEHEQLTKFSADGLRGKYLDKGESFWFEGANGRKVQGWALKPAGFQSGENKKWPVVFLIHGGPQGAWEDQWSTRWNPNVFAQQGYFVLAINPTGSTTFGQEFVDAIAGDWGGKPFVDLKKGWDHALKTYPEIDPERAAAAGASWGGYAINWIQSNPEFGFGFKALICHDGVFYTHYNGYSTDELFFWNHDFGGNAWEEKAKAIARKFNPAELVHKWSTPQLIIHGSKDYRLPETEGIGAFHALQRRGVPSRLVVFPDENHWVLNHGNSLKWHYEVFRWLHTYIGEGSLKSN